MPEKPYCCKPDCKADAEWDISWGEAPDDYTHACTAHVGEMLTDAPLHYIRPLNLKSAEGSEAGT